MAQYDGSIRINTEINSKNANAQLMSLGNRIVKTADKIASLRSKMDALKDAEVPTQEYAKLQNDISKATAKLEQLKAQQASLKSFGKMFSDDWKSLSEQSQEASANIHNIKQEMDALKSAGTAAKQVPTEEYAELERKLQSSKNFLSRFVEEQNKLKSEGKEYTEEWKELSRYIEFESSLIKEIEQKMQSLKDSGAAMKEVPTEEYSQLQNQLQKWQANARAIEAEQEKLRQSGKQFTSEWNNSANKIREARAQISSINTVMRALEQEGKAFAAGEETEEYARLSQQLQYAENDMRVLNQRHQELKNRQAKNADGYRRLGRAAQEGAKKANKAVKGMGDTLKIGFKNILKYGLGIRSFYALINKIRTAIKEGFSNFANYSASFKSAVNGLKASALTLKNSFAAAFSPLVEIAIPYIQRVVDYLVKLMDVIGQVMAAIMGQKNYTRAIKQTTAAIEDQRKAQNKQLSGLDKLNNLTSSNGAGSVDSGAGNMFEEAPVDNKILDFLQNIKVLLRPAIDYAQKLKDIFSQGFFDGLGDWEYRWESIKASIASIKDSLIDIWADPAVLSAGDRWAQSVAYLLGSIAGSMTSIGLTIATNLIGGMAKYLEQNKERIKGYLVSMFDIWAEINQKFSELFQSISYVFEAFSSEQGKQLTANLIGIFADAFMGINELCIKHMRDMLNIFIQPFVDNKEAFRTALEGFLSVVSEVTGTIKQGIDETFDKLNEVYDEHFKPFFESIANGLSDTVGKFLEFWNGSVQPILDEWADNFDTLWKEHVQSMLNNFIELLGDAADFLKAIWENIIKPFIDWIIEKILPVLLPIIDGVVKALMSAAGMIADEVSGIIDVIRGIIQFLTGVFTGDWKKAWEGITKIFEGVKNTIKGTVNGIIGIVESLANGVVKGINTVIQSLNGLKFDIPDWVPGGLGGKEFGFNIPELKQVSIPKLATGAVIPANNEFLAVLGDQKHGTNIEAPLDTIVDAVMIALNNIGFGNNFGNGKMTLEVPIYLDKREIGRGMREYDMEFFMKRGKGAFEH